MDVMVSRNLSRICKRIVARASYVRKEIIQLFIDVFYSQHNFLNLIKSDLIVPPIIQFRRPRALMVCHLLRVLEETAILQIDGDPGRAERVTAELGLDAGSSR